MILPTADIFNRTYEIVQTTTVKETTVHKVQRLTYQYFGASGSQAVGVFVCESGLNPKAQSRTHDHGVAQINLPAHRDQIPGQTDSEKISWLENPENNIKLALQLYMASGWNPWNSSKGCWA